MVKEIKRKEKREGGGGRERVKRKQMERESMHHNVSYAAAVYNGNNTDDVMTPYLLQAVTRPYNRTVFHSLLGRLSTRAVYTHTNMHIRISKLCPELRCVLIVVRTPSEAPKHSTLQFGEKIVSYRTPN